MRTICFFGIPLLAGAVCPFMSAGTPPSDKAVIPHPHKYDEALQQLDVSALEADIVDLMTSSQECWPADLGNYGPFFIRLAWHCSGSYRRSDGSGGCGGGRQRFEPERSWDDNTNLDKARALLAPLKEKYGDGLSWGDLFTYAGTVAIKNMGGPVQDFCFGRLDDADGTASLVLGPTPEQEKVAPCDINGKCKEPLGSTTVGLIYLNPEGPIDDEGKPQPVPALSALDVRDAFARMGMNDTETVALIGGGHAFGKTHGACPAGAGPSPQEDPYNPWPGKCGTGVGEDAFTSGFEGPWTTDPNKWDNEFFKALISERWEKHIGPGGHWQWKTANPESPYASTMRLTSDLALLEDPSFAAISHEFAEDQGKLDVAFAEAWNKLVTNGGVWSSVSKCTMWSAKSVVV
jgi:catalase (peroxidase I)